MNPNPDPNPNPNPNPNPVPNPVSNPDQASEPLPLPSGLGTLLITPAAPRALSARLGLAWAVTGETCGPLLLRAVDAYRLNPSPNPPRP